MSAVIETPVTDPMMSMIERAARDPAVDIEKLERLFSLRERTISGEKEVSAQMLIH